MFETAQLMIQQNAALSNPQAPAPVEKVLTAEQRAAKAAGQHTGWQALHERYQREAGTRRSY